MKVLVLSNRRLEEKEIKEGLDSLQEIVGGYIEIPFLSETLNDNGIDIIINEEGKLIEGMKPEIAVVNKKRGNVLDIVYGNCIFASHNEEGDTVGLSKEQIEIVNRELKTFVQLIDRNTAKSFEMRALFI